MDPEDFGGFEQPADNSSEGDTSPVDDGNIGDQGSPEPVSDGTNPAWNPVLENIPPEFHNVLTPHFKEWDANYQRGLEKARSEVQSQYAPFQQFLDNKIDPTQLEQGHQIYQMLENNPQQIYEALKAEFEQQETPAQNDQGQGDSDYYDPGAIENNPQFQELQNNFNSMVEAMENQTQQQQEQQAYEEELSNIQETVENLSGQFQQTHGFEMDREQVLRIALQNMEMNNADQLDIPGAANEFAELVNKYRTPTPPPGQQTPNILPTSGGIPQANFDVTKLDEDQRQELVAQMLRNAQEN